MPVPPVAVQRSQAGNQATLSYTNVALKCYILFLSILAVCVAAVAKCQIVGEAHDVQRYWWLAAAAAAGQSLEQDNIISNVTVTAPTLNTQTRNHK